jgi:transposase
MVQVMPVAVVARMVDEWDTRLWRVIHHYVEAARARLDHSNVTSVAFDETASRRGRNHESIAAHHELNFELRSWEPTTIFCSES